jgi:hypothetical protein
VSPQAPEGQPRRAGYRILSEKYGQALADAGLIPADMLTDVHRIIIDAQAGDALMVWLELFADERWLDVLPPEGVQVIRERPSSAESERLEAARQVLLADGYFRPDQVGPDVAPRIVERISALRRELELALLEVQVAHTQARSHAIGYRVNGQDYPPEQVEIIREAPPPS